MFGKNNSLDELGVEREIIGFLNRRSSRYPSDRLQLLLLIYWLLLAEKSGDTVRLNAEWTSNLLELKTRCGNSSDLLIPEHAKVDHGGLKKINHSIARTSRAEVMADELWHAIRNTSTSQLNAFGQDVFCDLAGSLSRRVQGVFSLVGRLVEVATSELVEAYNAIKADQAKEHFNQRSTAAVERGYAVYERTSKNVAILVHGLKNDPAQAAPRLLILVLASLASSGGVDGDGGASDLDIQLFGIGGHRSPFTHSILMGAALETCLLAVTRLVICVHGNLHAKHDPLWDLIRQHSAELIDAAARGVSAGLAYHLLVDGLLQPAPYHGLPLELPIEIHQSLFVANAVAEAIATFPQEINPNRKNATPAPEQDKIQKFSTFQKLNRLDPKPPDEKYLLSKQELAIHRKLAEKRWEVPLRLKKWLTGEEIALLEKYRYRLAALAGGRIRPRNIEQRHFLMVAKKQAIPNSIIEYAWVALAEASSLDWQEQKRSARLVIH